MTAQVHDPKGKGFAKWDINGVVFEDFTSPILVDFLNGNRSRVIDFTTLKDGFDLTRKTYPLKKNEVIDMVFQNSVGPSGTCEYHPWHTHGHAFWDLTSGPGKYPEGLDQSTVLANPVIRDTTIVYPNPTAKGVPDAACGWRLVRFVADNPGVWAVHCHIIPHMISGLMFVMEEAVDEIPLIPQQ
jgi:FtsP/CotA-like multicopper oxidase with cupredoxin domain